MQAEQESLETKNHELVDAYKKKTRSQQQTNQLYQSLKAQVMASQVANAAGDEAEYALQSARGDRFIDRLPGARVGSVNLHRLNENQQTAGGRFHNRNMSRSSGSNGHQPGSIGLGSQHVSQRALNNRHIGREFPFLYAIGIAKMRTSSMSQRLTSMQSLGLLARLKRSEAAFPYSAVHARICT